MKTFLRAIVLALCAGLMAAPARAQFPSTQTNVSFAGNGNHFLSGATITFDSGSVMLFKSNSATTNQLLFVSDTSGTVKPLTLGSNLSITGSTLNGTAFDPNAVQTLTNKTINGANNTLTIRAAQDITGVLPVANGGTNLTAGTSGGIPYYSSSSTMASSAAFSTSQILIGGGAGSPPATLGALGSNVTVLHGNATGPPAFSSVDLAADVTGTLPFAHGGTGLASGTSGGVVYFSSSSALASSSTLSANYIVIGGGAGTAPSIVATTGTTTTVLHGNASGPPTFGATSLTADVSGTLPVANGGTGAVTLTANNIVIGNTTGAVTFLAPGTSGNVVTSNGTAWVSATSSGSGNVTGPGSSTNNAVATWNSTGGTSLNNSNITIVSATLKSTATNDLVIGTADEGTGITFSHTAATAKFGTAQTVFAGNPGAVVDSTGVALSVYGASASNAGIEVGETDNTPYFKFSDNAGTYRGWFGTQTGGAILRITGGTNMDLSLMAGDSTTTGLTILHSSGDAKLHGNFLFGDSPTDNSNGLIQFPSSTSASAGAVFGNDTPQASIYRSAASTITSPAAWLFGSSIRTTAGTSTTAPNVGGTIFDHYADVGNGADTTEDTLYTDTIAANVLSANGNKLVAYYGVNVVLSATATREIKIYFAGTAIIDTTALTFTSTGVATFRVMIIRDTSTSIRYSVMPLVDSGTAALGVSPTVGKLTGLTLSGTNIIKITGQSSGTGGGNANDIVATLGTCEFKPAF